VPLCSQIDRETADWLIVIVIADTLQPLPCLTVSTLCTAELHNCALVYSFVHRFGQVCTGVLRCTQVLTCVLRSQVWTGVLQQVCSGADRCAQVWTGVLMCTQVLTCVHRFGQVFSGLDRCTQVCSGADRYAQVSTGVCLCVDGGGRSVALCRSMKHAYQSAVENAFRCTQVCTGVSVCRRWWAECTAV